MRWRLPRLTSAAVSAAWCEAGSGRRTRRRRGATAAVGAAVRSRRWEKVAAAAPGDDGGGCVGLPRFQPAPRPHLPEQMESM
jgi:hypothetical protein